MTISVGLNSDNKTVYNIGKIKRMLFPGKVLKGTWSSEAPHAEQHSDNILQQKYEKVKVLMKII